MSRGSHRQWLERRGRSDVRSNMCTTLEHVFERMQAPGSNICSAFAPVHRRHAGSNRCLIPGPAEDYGGQHFNCKERFRHGQVGRQEVIAMPDGPPDATGLTPRQQRVLATIKDSIETKGYPPTMREIGKAVGLTSSSSVAHQLECSRARASSGATPTGRAPWRCSCPR